MEMMNNSDPA